MVDVDIGGLRATLTIDGQEFEQGLKKAEDQTTQFQQKTDDLNASLINLASGIYVAQQAYYYAEKALTLFTSSTVNAYDQVDAFNRLTGTSIEEGGKWKDMLERMNLSLSDMTYTFRSFSNNLQTALADPNSSASKAFKQLGIVLTDNKGQLKDNNQLMLETIAAFQKMPDGMQKTALAFDLLGRGAININKLLKEGKDIITDYGQAISNETEAGKEKVDKFKLAWAEYNDVIEDTKSKLGEGLLPAFTTFVNFLTTKVLPILDEVGSRFERIGYVMGAYMRFGNKVSEAKTPEERETTRQEFMSDLSGDIDKKFLEAKELSYTAPSEEKQQKMLTTISQKVRGYGKLTAEEIEWASKYSPELLTEYNTKVTSWTPTEKDIIAARKKGVGVETLNPYAEKPSEQVTEDKETIARRNWFAEHPLEPYPGASTTKPTSIPVTVTQPVTTQPQLPEVKTVEPYTIPITPPETQTIPVVSPAQQKIPIEKVTPQTIPVVPVAEQIVPIAKIPEQRIPVETPKTVEVPITPIKPIDIKVNDIAPIDIPIKDIEPVEIPIQKPDIVKIDIEKPKFTTPISEAFSQPDKEETKAAIKDFTTAIKNFFIPKEKGVSVKPVEPIEIPIKKPDVVVVDIQKAPEQKPIGYKEGLMNVPIYEKPKQTFAEAQEKLSEPQIASPPITPIPTAPQLPTVPPQEQKIPEAMVVTEKGQTVKSFKTPEEEISTVLSGVKAHATSIQTKKLMNMEYSAEYKEMEQELQDAQVFIVSSGSKRIQEVYADMFKAIKSGEISTINELLDESLANTMTNAKTATEAYKDSIKDLNRLKEDSLKTDRDYYENIQRAGRDVGQMRDLTIAYKRTKREQQETFTESTQRAQEAGAVMVQSGGTVSKDTWNITINASKDYPIEKIIADLNTYQEAERRRKGIPTGG